MRLRRLPLCLAVIGSSSIACSDGTGPAAFAVTTVVVERDTIVASSEQAGSITWLRFTLPVTIRNEGPSPVDFDYCASSVAVEAGGAWQHVWFPSCFLSVRVPHPIPPGEERHVELEIQAALAGPGAPRWEHDETAGRYHVMAALQPTGRGGAIPRVASNPFELIIAP